MTISEKPRYAVYGVLIDGTEEKFRFDFVDRTDANKKANELRRIIQGVRFNLNQGSKYQSIIVKEE